MTEPAACRNCRQPMESFVAGEHDLCGVYCAVMANAPIDGLDDGEIAKQFVAELVDGIDGFSADDELTALQRGLAQLLYRLTDADGRIPQRTVATHVHRFLLETRRP